MDYTILISVSLQYYVERNTIDTTCTGHCSFTNGQFRLTNGSTNREGRVEVCVDGRWGTVCNNSQEGIAGAVCSQLGFPAEGVLHCTYNNTSINQCTQELQQILDCKKKLIWREKCSIVIPTVLVQTQTVTI